MVYSSPVTTAESFTQYYSSWSRYADGSDGLNGPPDEATLDRYRNTVALAAPHLGSPDSCILDVGCLEGGLLTHFQKAGFNRVYGVDPAPVSARRAAQSGLDVRTGTVDAIPFPDHYFDFIFCIHVLEHVVDLSAIDCFRVLAPGGRVYIETPDCVAYDPFSPDLLFDLSLEHINHFSLFTLKRFMKLHGFRALEAGIRTYTSAPGRAKMQDSVYGIFLKGSSGKDPEEEMGAQSEALSSYVRLSQSRVTELNDRLSRFVSPEEPYSLWGTGHAAFRLLGLPALRRARLAAATDSNPLYWGKRLRGVEVISPDDFLAGSGKVVITSAIHGAAIAARLGNSGWKGEVFFP